MARLTETEKTRLIADLGTGIYSVRDLAKKYGISVSSVQAYKPKIDPETERIVNAGVAYKTGLALISDNAKANAITNAVDERTKHLAFFTSAAVKNVQSAMKEPCEGQADYRMRADTILRGKETVLGKQPDTAIQINNNAQTKTLADFYGE